MDWQGLYCWGNNGTGDVGRAVYCSLLQFVSYIDKLDGRGEAHSLHRGVNYPAVKRASISVSSSRPAVRVIKPNLRTRGGRSSIKQPQRDASDCWPDCGQFTRLVYASHRHRKVAGPISHDTFIFMVIFIHHNNGSSKKEYRI